MAIRETEVENHLRWAVARVGGLVYKFKSPNNRGVYDDVVALPNGQTWFVETKRPKGGKLSPLQVKFGAEMKMRKQKCAVLATKEEIDAWLHSALTK